MKKYFLFIICLLHLKISFADDGIINSYGGNLICIKETKIILKKETLTFTQLKGGMLVDIYFEFVNPEEERNEVVGFITPAFSSPEDRSESYTNIENFVVIVNDKMVVYNISKVTNTEFSSILDKKLQNSFAYYFDVKFNKGINTIRHSYFFKPASLAAGCCGISSYTYRLTTGKNWANKTIEDFELKINKQGLFRVPLYLDDSPNNTWEIMGFGKISKKSHEPYSKNKSLDVNIKTGYLYFHAVDFSPEYDINISSYQLIDDFEPLRTIYWSSMNNGAGLDTLTKEDYRIAKNALFAYHGYEFRDKELFDYFSKYFWYIPDPNIRNDIEILNSIEKRLFNRIIELEE